MASRMAMRIQRRGFVAREREREKADGQNSKHQQQKSPWPKSSMRIEQTLLLIFVGHSISRGQRCTGISTRAGGIWRNRSHRPALANTSWLINLVMFGDVVDWGTRRPRRAALVGAFSSSHPDGWWGVRSAAA
jgi:hypothetical protein